MPKSRKLLDKKEIYCRRCQELKTDKNFYSALDGDLDKNGYMSVCKTCCNDIFVLNLNSHLDVKKAMLFTCKILNIAFVEDSLSAALTQVGEDFNPDTFFGIYKSKVGNYFKTKPSMVMTFESYTSDMKFNVEEENKIVETEGIDYSEYLKTTWGSGMTIDDYNFLESSFSEWKRTHKCDTNSETVLMKEICHLELSVRKAREMGQSTDKLVKSLQDLIKTANLSPAQANMMNASKGNEVFGMWIKDIEELEPAEWWDENRKLFVDVDNISQYFEDFVVRPIKNFITRSKDFNVRSNVSGNLDFDIRESEEELEGD